jgi:hypothetical protein
MGRKYGGNEKESDKGTGESSGLGQPKSVDNKYKKGIKIIHGI